VDIFVRRHPSHRAAAGVPRAFVVGTALANLRLRIHAMRRPEDNSALMRALAGYLHAHPQASDTCEGAHAWWLGRPEDATVPQVREALDALVDRGCVVRNAAPDGRVRYRCRDVNPETIARLARIARGEEEGTGTT
jgi:hypothetical protein